jgi:molybdopterin-guanine dinucleotide biosynthesis protein A
MGRPKAWLPFGSERLLSRVTRRVGQWVDLVVVVAAPSQDLPELPPGTVVVRDPVAGLGPLAGLLAGLQELPTPVDWAYLTSVDAPLLADGWISRLAQWTDGHDLVLPQSEGYAHPLSALYRCEPAAIAAEAMLDAGARRLLDLAQYLRTRHVEADLLREIDPELNTLRNLNTPADYRSALMVVGFEPPDNDESWPVDV